LEKTSFAGCAGGYISPLRKRRSAYVIGQILADGGATVLAATP
jgi:hypothetical protein